MKKCFALILIAGVLYCLGYVLGTGVIAKHPSLIRAFHALFYPLDFLHARGLKERVQLEKGILRQSADGSWSITYPEPRKAADGRGQVDGISFRVPVELAPEVATLRGRSVQGAIGMEPMGICRSYVLRSVAPED